MSTIDFLNLITNRAKEYRKDAILSLQRNNHINNLQKDEVIDQNHVDAILTDFINYIGTHGGVDYALYTSDLIKDK